ncbi:CehA/McbA family metallohydrolase [Peteryoungia desertarenae]|uniref:CehA/McbA family metallohydrolase n=1 Tax=Peteryoungia desertarenae TaxID=1813451 RepID=A0ABX6QIY9_9HYPH|nr:CehA/McbA family metallohydrolase [Peteryoungia desertarenae]QLF68454.1 CehA/McbA family metallohydrolase [Peteryoungia desertarenae]
MSTAAEEFNFKIDQFPEGEKSFIELPFTVSNDVERIEVSYHFPFGGGGSVIDIGVAQHGVMRGWSGAERGFITIEENRTTPGYDRGPLPGQWHVVLGIVKIGPDCKVDVTVRLVPRKGRWLAGELHSHSEHSDGGVTVYDAIHRARAARLDFLAITDHNTISQNTIRPDDPEMLVIPAMELTSFYGHTNFLGLNRPIVDWRCRSPRDVANKMAEASANGATIIINHPFQNSAGGRWQAGFDVTFDALEIWNGLWTPMNEQALAFWQVLLVSGRQVPVTGGSDFHLKNRRRHGHPANRLYVEGTAIADILEAVKLGRNVVASSPEDTMVKPVADITPPFGEILPQGATVALEFSGLAIGDEIRVITEKGLVDTIQSTAGRHLLERMLECQFIRFEVWHGAKPRLFTNPYYSE